MLLSFSDRLYCAWILCELDEYSIHLILYTKRRRELYETDLFINTLSLSEPSNLP